jgi:hypothetical protein
MPNMELDTTSWLLGHYDVWQRVLAYLRWPDDEERRGAHIATTFVIALNEIEKLEPPDTGFELAQSLISTSLMDDFKDLAGGFSSLLPFCGTPRPKEDWPLTEWRTAAMVLILVRAIDVYGEVRGGASINKAIYLIEQDKGKIGCLKNRHDIFGSWIKYRNVSHLAAALFILPRDELDLVGLGMFLIIALYYQKFGTSFIPKSRSEPLLDEQSIWSVPEDLELPDCPEALIPKLDAEGIAALLEYRAPY